MQFKKQDFFTIPNILTYIRIILVPIFVVVYINAKTFTDNLWAIGIVVLSALTDVADGIIARRYNLITDWGKIIDPIADKAMQFAMLFCVVFKYHWVAILIIIYAVKEVVSLSFSGYLFTKGKHINGAVWAGKICTAILYIVMIILIAVPDVDNRVVNLMIGFSAAFMLIAFFVYMRFYVHLLHELKEEENSGK